jgi:hypothetical protein
MPGSEVLAFALLLIRTDFSFVVKELAACLLDGYSCADEAHVLCMMEEHSPLLLDAEDLIRTRCLPSASAPGPQ